VLDLHPTLRLNTEDVISQRRNPLAKGKRLMVMDQFTLLQIGFSRCFACKWLGYPGFGDLKKREFVQLLQICNQEINCEISRSRGDSRNNKFQINRTQYPTEMMGIFGHIEVALKGDPS